MPWNARSGAPGSPSRRKAHTTSDAILMLTALPSSSATRLSQRRLGRGRVLHAASGEVTLRPTPDLLEGR